MESGAGPAAGAEVPTRPGGALPGHPQTTGEQQSLEPSQDSISGTTCAPCVGCSAQDSANVGQGSDSSMGATPFTVHELLPKACPASVDKCLQMPWQAILPTSRFTPIHCRIWPATRVEETMPGGTPQDHPQMTEEQHNLEPSQDSFPGQTPCCPPFISRTPPDIYLNRPRQPPPPHMPHLNSFMCMYCRLIKSGDSIQVMGKVLPEAKSFAIDLVLNGPSLFRVHLKAKFESVDGDTKKLLVYNSLVDGERTEDFHLLHFPFDQGEEATISFHFTDEEVMVKLNGDQEIQFPYSKKMEYTECISVDGDLNLHSVSFT